MIGEVSNRGISKDEELTVVGFNPERGFNNARSGVQYIQLIWDGNCSELVQRHRRTLGKHRASWPDSAEGQNIERSRESPYRETEDHTAIVNEGLPDLHRYQTWDHVASSRLTLRVKRMQADMVTER